MRSPDRIVVIGAGVAGLCAARRLSDAGWDVVVLDKGRGPGGRLATRRLDVEGAAVADHGAQFFTVRQPKFEALVQNWPITVWHHGPTRATTVEDPGSIRAGTDGHPRYRGIGGMNSIAKHVAAGLDVRTGTRVQTISQTDGGWLIVAEHGTTLTAAAVIVTAPVPQAIAMVAAPLPQDIASLAYTPTIALLAVLDGPAGLPDPGAIEFDGGVVHYLADNQAKGIATRPTITVHAAAAWSRSHFDDADDTVTERLAGLVRPWLASPITTSPIMASQVKRWRYAAPTSPHPDRAVQPIPGLVLAGDTFGEAKVEGAALSGLAAAELLLA